MWLELGILSVIAAVVAGATVGGMVRAWGLKTHLAELQNRADGFDKRLADLQAEIILEKRKRASADGVEAKRSMRSNVDEMVQLLKAKQVPQNDVPWLYRGE